VNEIIRVRRKTQTTRSSRTQRRRRITQTRTTVMIKNTVDINGGDIDGENTIARYDIDGENTIARYDIDGEKEGGQHRKKQKT
jgi:hypothetical protein